MKKKQIIGSIMAATGESVEALAKKHNYSKFAFYDVINGRTKTPYIQNVISSTTGVPVDKLFPKPQPEEHHA